MSLGVPGITLERWNDDALTSRNGGGKLGLIFKGLCYVKRFRECDAPMCIYIYMIYVIYIYIHIYIYTIFICIAISCIFHANFLRRQKKFPFNQVHYPRCQACAFVVLDRQRSRSQVVAVGWIRWKQATKRHWSSDQFKGPWGRLCCVVLVGWFFGGMKYILYT